MIEVEMSREDRGALERLFGPQVDPEGHWTVDLGVLLMPFGWKDGDGVRIVPHQVRSIQLWRHDKELPTRLATGRGVVKPLGWSLRRNALWGEQSTVAAFIFSVVYPRTGV